MKNRINLYKNKRIDQDSLPTTKLFLAKVVGVWRLNKQQEPIIKMMSKNKLTK
jgi:hypothetical protein